MPFVFELFFIILHCSVLAGAQGGGSPRWTLLPETNNVASAVGTAHDVDGYEYRQKIILVLQFPSPTNRTETVVAAFFEQAVLHRCLTDNTIDCEICRCEVGLIGSPLSYPKPTG